LYHTNIKKIIFTALTWDSIRHDRKCAHRQIQNIISGLLTVKYKSDPIILQYLMMSIFLPFSSISSLIDVSMGLSTYLTCSIQNIFSRSLMYLLWLTKMSSLFCLTCNPRKKFNSLIMLISN
jgi:hypothetical protein